MQAIENGEVEDNRTGPNSLDKERSLLNDDPKWMDTTYVLANYKTEPCKKPPRLCRYRYLFCYLHFNTMGAKISLGGGGGVRIFVGSGPIIWDRIWHRCRI
jgi:hypothetical protein